MAEPDLSWRSQGNCVGVDPDLFFPGKGEPAKEAEARAVCAGCVVRDQCLEYAIAKPERWGIWGGETRQGRRRLARMAALRRAS